jgi:hypothetical protein
VLGFDCAAADVDAGTMNFANVQRIERDASANDVADGIHGAYFVKVDFFNGHVVSVGFGFAETLKDRESVGLRPGGKMAGLDDFFNLRQMTVLFLFGKIDAKFGGGDAFTLGFVEAESGIEMEALQGGFDGGPIGAGIEQSADGHVATDAGKCVEIAEGHGITSVARGAEWARICASIFAECGVAGGVVGAQAAGLISVFAIRSQLGPLDGRLSGVFAIRSQFVVSPFFTVSCAPWRLEIEAERASRATGFLRFEPNSLPSRERDGDSKRFQFARSGERLKNFLIGCG